MKPKIFKALGDRNIWIVSRPGYGFGSIQISYYNSWEEARDSVVSKHRRLGGGLYTTSDAPNLDPFLGAFPSRGWIIA